MYKVYRENSTKMIDKEIIHRYIHGGRGAVDLIAPSGKKHTYLFLRPRNGLYYPSDIVFVYALHNDETKFYVGMIEENKFRLTCHSRFLEDTEIVRGAKYIVKMATIDNFAEKSAMTLNHLGVCCRCGRPLTQDEALHQGIGKKCKKKYDKFVSDSENKKYAR